MNAKTTWAGMITALSLAASPVFAANTLPKQDPAASAATAAAAAAEALVIDPAVLAKVVPGIDKAQVKSLLGAPWRTVQYNDLDQVENQIWEYRGKDAHGTYRVHIEFDKHGKVLIVGKIADRPAVKGTRAES